MITAMSYLKLDPSIVCVLIVFACLIHSFFTPETTDTYGNVIVAIVSGYLGYLKGSGT
jgi:Na+/H+-translocating membrane pyrophosphatase